MQSLPKPQFASWLIAQVETGQYTGLCYVGQNKFRVPWKHNSRKDCNDEDSKIFRAWAVASGKINEFPNDKARWKTNFRCALNNLSVRFRMVQDNSKNSDDPHKIYEIVNTEYYYENLLTQDSQEDSDRTPDIYSSPIECFPLGTEQDLLSNFIAMDIGNQSIEEQQWADSYSQQNPVGYGVTAETQPQVAPNQAAQYDGTPVRSPRTWNTVFNWIYKTACYLFAATPPQVMAPNICDLEISIHYRKTEMLKTTVTAPRLQLHYLHEAPELQAHHICFPSAEGLLDHKQKEYTNRILGSIQKGLLLEVQDTGIYAWRHDRCHVFASTSDPNVADPNPRKLPQNERVELLSFEKYVHELKQFRENQGGSPQYTINMCFGEKFPDGKALEKKLIVVKVVPLICRHFHDAAHMEGASSLHSANISLQMSHNSLFDLISSVFALPSTEQDAAQLSAAFLSQA